MPSKISSQVSDVSGGSSESPRLCCGLSSIFFDGLLFFGFAITSPSLTLETSFCFSTPFPLNFFFGLFADPLDAPSAFLFKVPLSPGDCLDFSFAVDSLLFCSLFFETFCPSLGDLSLFFELFQLSSGDSPCFFELSIGTFLGGPSVCSIFLSFLDFSCSSCFPFSRGFQLLPLASPS